MRASNPLQTRCLRESAQYAHMRNPTAQTHAADTTKQHLSPLRTPYPPPLTLSLLQLTVFACLATLLLLLSASPAVADPTDSPMVVRAVVRGSAAFPIINGVITFTQNSTGLPVSIVGNFTGLAPGTYGFHIHQYGDPTSGQDENINGGNIDLTNVVGTHFTVSPYDSHGCWPSTNRHVGDLGNFTVTDFDGFTEVFMTRDLLDLSPASNHSIVGRMVIIHQEPDMCDQPTGHAGTPMAQGVIGIADATRYGYPLATSNAAGISIPWVGNSPPAGDSPVTAVAFLRPTVSAGLDNPDNPLTGTVYFSQILYYQDSHDSRIRIRINITGLDPYSSHGIHIHNWGDETDDNSGSTVGSHFNPNNTRHGLPSMGKHQRHAGDLGNILADANGAVFKDFHVDVVSLIGRENIIGRSIAIHSLPDTGDEPLGSSGAQIMIGAIGLSRKILPDAPMDGWFASTTVRGSYAYPKIFGTLNFQQPQGPGLFSGVTITGTIFGLEPGASYAMHIHDFGDISSGMTEDDPYINPAIIGGHFNPLNQLHGCPPLINRHAGDMGTIVAPPTSRTTGTPINFINPLIDLGDTIKSVIGRALVLHNDSDHCIQPMGNSGSPIAQGVIAVSPPLDGYINLANNLGINQTASLSTILYPTPDGQGVGGSVQIYLSDTKKFRVVLKLSGLDPFTAHGIHMHTYGNDDPAQPHSAMGVHYNPLDMPHDLPSPISNARHLGDLGVVSSDAGGAIDEDLTLDFSSAAFHLVNNLRGRGFLLHAVADSGEQPDGGTGAHLAKGVLGLSGRAMPPQPQIYSSFCDRYAGILGMNTTFFIQSALWRALWGVSEKKTGMRFPDGNGPPALHEVTGCMSEDSLIKEWFNGGIGYRTRRSPPPLIPPAPDFTDEENPEALLSLIKHMTEYFAILLQCSDYNSASNYTGVQNMYVVHAGMLLGVETYTYFGMQLKSAFTSFGCSPDDVFKAMNPIMARFLRGNRFATNAIQVCTEDNCRCAPNLCGTDCTPQACQPLKINGSLPRYDKGYSYDTPITIAAGDARYQLQWITLAVLALAATLFINIRN